MIIKIEWYRKSYVIFLWQNSSMWNKNFLNLWLDTIIEHQNFWRMVVLSKMDDIFILCMSTKSRLYQPSNIFKYGIGHISIKHNFYQGAIDRCFFYIKLYEYCIYTVFIVCCRVLYHSFLYLAYCLKSFWIKDYYLTSTNSRSTSTKMVFIRWCERRKVLYICIWSRADKSRNVTQMKKRQHANF